MAKPKLLLDENIGHVTGDFLLKQGYDVATIVHHEAGLRDELVLEKALKENRILVTLDSDFGRLIFQQSRRHVGVVFLRMKKESAENIRDLVYQVLSSYEDELYEKFVTASEAKMRVK